MLLSPSGSPANVTAGTWAETAAPFQIINQGVLPNYILVLL